MAKRLGNDRRLWIDYTGTPTYAEIKGQGNLRTSQSSALIDTSDKTNSPYGTSAPGLIALQVSLDVIPDLPDTNGYEKLRANFLAQTVTRFQIRRNGSSGVSPGDVELDGTFYITQCNETRDQNDVLKAQVVLVPAAAPTVNIAL